MNTAFNVRQFFKLLIIFLLLPILYNSLVLAINSDDDDEVGGNGKRVGKDPSTDGFELVDLPVVRPKVPSSKDSTEKKLQKVDGKKRRSNKSGDKKVTTKIDEEDEDDVTEMLSEYTIVDKTEEANKDPIREPSHGPLIYTSPLELVISLFGKSSLEVLFPELIITATKTDVDADGKNSIITGVQVVESSALTGEFYRVLIPLDNTFTHNVSLLIEKSNADELIKNTNDECKGAECQTHTWPNLRIPVKIKRMIKNKFYIQGSKDSTHTSNTNDDDDTDNNLEPSTTRDHHSQDDTNEGILIGEFSDSELD